VRLPLERGQDDVAGRSRSKEVAASFIVR